MKDELIDASEAQPVLGFRTKKALYAACERQEIPHYRLSKRRIRFSRVELAEFVKQAAARNGRVTVEQALAKVSSEKRPA
jgi:hypothetical protein